jgi:hypothetical protein
VEERRSTLCSLVDQVEAILTQTSSLSRHIEIIMRGLGGAPPSSPDTRQQQQRIGELRRSLSAPIGLSTMTKTNHTLQHSHTLQLQQILHEEEEEEEGDPFAEPSRPTSPCPSLPLSPTDDLGGGSTSLGLNALDSTRHDLNEHFDYLSRILLLRHHTLLDQVTGYLEKKSLYLRHRLPLLLRSRDEVYRHLLHLLRHLHTISTATLHQPPTLTTSTQLLRYTSSLLQPNAFLDESSSYAGLSLPLTALCDIAPFISAHGMVGGPAAPIDLTLKRTHNGYGTHVEVCWREGPRLRAEDDYLSTSTVDYYVIESAVLTPSPPPSTSPDPASGEGRPYYEYTLTQPFHAIAHVPHTLSSSCLIDIHDHPSSLLFFRIHAVSVTGVEGPSSMSLSLKTPSVFRPLFEYSGRPFDTNGLLYWLGTGGGGGGPPRSYENPHILREISLSASTLQGAIHPLASHAPLDTLSGGGGTGGGGGVNLCMTHNKMQSWFCVDISPPSASTPSSSPSHGRDRRYLQLHAYCLRSGRGESYKLRNWELHGKVSKRDKKWHILKRHKSCTDLKESSYSTAGWVINSLNRLTATATTEPPQPPSAAASSPAARSDGGVSRGGTHRGGGGGKGMKLPSSPSASLVMDSVEPPESSSEPQSFSQPLAYRYFRIIQTGLNSSGDHHLVCNGIELYGILFDHPL